ncbi:MAG: ATP-binding protein [Nitrososphaeria archaeon]
MDLRTYMLTKKESIKGLRIEERNIEINENKNFITSVVGSRRAGKTYFLYGLIRRRNLKDEDFVLLNFEEPVEIKDLDEAILGHHEVYNKEPTYLFLDEVQGLVGWEKHVYSLYERKRYFIFITGSSSKILSKEIATQLRGRAIPLHVFPFSFKEVLRVNKLELKKYYSSYELAKIRYLLSSCIKRGFFPDIVLGNIEPFTFFKEYLDLVIYRDIIERFGIRNRYALEFFLKSCISSNTSLVSVYKIFNTLKSQGIKISKKTLYAFQKIIEDINFGFFLKKFDWSKRKTELSLPKFYLVDNAIYTYFEREDAGKLMENIVFLELVKKNLVPNENIFYWRSNRGDEIDFVIKKDAQIEELIQVTYASGKDEIERREIEALIKASAELICNNLLVITWNYEDELVFDNIKIKFLPLWKWLSMVTI